jgi:acyl-CoA hydrolase
MDILVCITQHLVKSEELNHHGTLYAGRSAEWFVESGFIAAATLTAPQNIVCKQIHGMSFNRPVRRGEVVVFESKIVLAGRSRLIANIKMKVKGEVVVDGFITFVHVDENGQTLPHGIEINAATAEDIALQEQARKLAVY